MKKELPKQEPKKKQGDIRAVIAFILFVMLVAGSFSLQVFSATEILQTNRLLATFQHTDTIKPDCAAGFVNIDGKCYVTIGLAKGRACGKSEGYHDLAAPVDEGEGIE